MPTSSTSINELAAESLAHIFAFLPPDERVRLERVCRQWRDLVKKYGWTEFRTLSLDWQELRRDGDLAFAKYRALIGRCTPHLRELSTAMVDCNVEQWAMMRNLRHLRFDVCVSSSTLRAVADNLKRLQSIHFSDINWRSVAVLHDLLRINNASLQALHLPLCNSRGDSLCLPALPSSLRLLHLGARSESNNFYLLDGERTRNCIEELLELAATCCPELAILMLPAYFGTSELSLNKLARFEKLLYLRLNFIPFGANLLAFGNSLARIGAKLRALLLDGVSPRLLQLIAEHCPLLEHFSFRIIIYNFVQAQAENPLLSALQSVFQLAHLRSVSLFSIPCSSGSGLRAQILDSINGLNAKGTLEYLHLYSEFPVPAELITNLIQRNPRLRKLACKIESNDHTDESDKLKVLLQNMDGPLELELFEQIPPELQMGAKGNTRIRIIERFQQEQCICHPILRQLWARTMGSASVPTIAFLK